ncbi:MAG: hypothetical protein RTU30_12955 [Candidatus Thorarchaeota archaeon]
MPHFGLIKPGLSTDEDALYRAKLHVRGGRIRLSQGSVPDAVAAFYDALSSAMQHYVSSPKHVRVLDIRRGENLDNDRTLFTILKRSWIIDDSVSGSDFEFIYKAMDDAIEGKLIDLDSDHFVSVLENILTQLEVLPIVEGELPDELPATL